jgi:hypothetical protein
MIKSQKGFEARSQRFRDNQRESSRLARTAALTGAAVAGVAVLGSARTAKADLVYSWRDLMNASSGWQNISAYDVLTLNGNFPTKNNIDIGGFSNDGGGNLIVTGYLRNIDPNYKGDLSGSFDRDYLGIGGKPQSWLAVEKNAIDSGTGKAYIGDLNTSTGVLTIDSLNRTWDMTQMEINGISGVAGAAEMPGCTYTGTLTAPSVNLVPEPASGLVMAIGLAAAGIARKFRKKN